jgi:hypothetical protein
MGKRNNSNLVRTTTTTGDLLYKGVLVGTYTTCTLNCADINRNLKKEKKSKESGV